MPRCEYHECEFEATHEVKVWINGDRSNFPERKLCDWHAGETVKSGRAIKITNYEYQNQ